MPWFPNRMRDFFIYSNINNYFFYNIKCYYKINK